MKKEKKRNILWLLILLLCAVIIGLLVWFFRFYKNAEETPEDDFFDPAAITGILPDMSEEEIEAELNRVVEEGMLNISISSEISFSDGTGKGKANIYNVEANNYIFKVAITLDDTGETVYESGGIQPGQYIQYIELEKDLDAGQYPATASFTAYTQDTHQIVGSAAAQIDLYIQS
jgi:methionine-rich copper-binding protein CopC